MPLEIDCGLLLNPVNGEVTSTKTTIGSVANYSCGAGFVLMGPSSRICGMDGSWSREIPVCKGEFMKIVCSLCKVFS